MATLAIQTENGKAFEYAMLASLQSHLVNTQPIIIQPTAALETAQQFYHNADIALRTDMDFAANAAIRTLLQMEPQLGNPLNNTPLYLAIQEDAAGIAGDVRDVLTIRVQNNWQIGISCKHNHGAVKHSRLSPNIDFGQMWLGIPCSQRYFEVIIPIFDELRAMKANNQLWREVENKDARFYVTILRAFMEELQRLDRDYPNTIPTRLLGYLLGTSDFYKVITQDRRRITQIQAFNLYGTLNRNAGNIRPQIRLQQLSLPTRIFDINFKPGSTNTVHIVCDQGWTISMRIHSASTRVEPSLKFDVTLIGVPPTLYTHYEPWG